MSQFRYPTGIQLETLVSEFKSKLSINSEELVEDYVTSPNVVGLEDGLTQNVQDAVSVSLGLRANSIIIVGSAKIGFRIHKNEKLGKSPFDSFSEDSDIDVAVISSELFDMIWLELFQFQLSKRDWASREQFEKYFFRGWIRPDKLPTKFAWRYRWFDLFRDVGLQFERGRHTFSGGLYKSHDFLLAYQNESFAKCLRSLRKI